MANLNVFKRKEASKKSFIEAKHKSIFSKLNNSKNNTRYFSILVAALGCFTLNSCSDDNDNQSVSNFELNINGLEDLGANYVYEGWIMVDGSPVTSGRFTVNANGELSQKTFSIPTKTLNAATAFILTIEPAVGDDPAPSAVHLLAGNFNGNSGTMTIEDSRAVGTNFSTATGKYILATPTNDNPDDDYSGVWFIDNSSGSGVAGLNLPTLPNGWIYEGWAVVNGTPVSTGTFSSVTGSDNFSGFSGPNQGPPFPGEDFLMNAPANLTFPTDIRGGAIVISVEPVPDNSTAPFLLKPLVHSTPANTPFRTTQTMNQNSSSIPTGTFMRK